MLISFKGVNGQLELYEDKIIIKRKGALAKMTQGFTKGDKTIYIRQITGIDFKPGGNFINGYIQFTVPGGLERTMGAFQATQDENSLVFKKQDNDIIVEIKEKIEEIQQRGELSYQPVTSSSNNAEEIRKYKDLYDDGIIAEEEFEAKKKQLLGI